MFRRHICLTRQEGESERERERESKSERERRWGKHRRTQNFGKSCFLSNGFLVFRRELFRNSENEKNEEEEKSLKTNKKQKNKIKDKKWKQLKEISNFEIGLKNFAARARLRFFFCWLKIQQSFWKHFQSWENSDFPARRLAASALSEKYYLRGQ